MKIMNQDINNDINSMNGNNQMSNVPVQPLNNNMNFNQPISNQMPNNQNLNMNYQAPKKNTTRYIIIGILILILILIVVVVTNEKKEKQKKENTSSEEIKDKVEINGNVINCTFKGELIPGVEYTNGEYTYRYKQEVKEGSVFEDSIKWQYIDEDGWGVVHNKRESSDKVTTNLCTYINNKPVVSMNYMFYGSLASEIDTSSFNTKNVVRMDQTFAVMVNLKELDLSKFNTSNVESMYFMFSNCYAKKIDVSNFNTSKVKEMAGMFGSTDTNILDLSSFDTSNVEYNGMMFYNTKATIGYARTQKDADFFNNSSDKPSTLIFVVKK